MIEVEGIRMAAPLDIAAMKLNVITGNGTWLKDFIDVAYLSSSLTFSQMIDAYEAKYITRNPAMAIKALGYHADINFDEPVEMVNGKYRWESVKKRLIEMSLLPANLFSEM